MTFRAASVVIYADATSIGIIQLTAYTAERLCHVNTMDSHTKSRLSFLAGKHELICWGPFVTVCFPGDRTTVSAVNPRTFYSNDDNRLLG